jgi:hypothetical protein
MMDTAIEPLENIVSQGVREGVFRELNPRLTAISIMASFHPFSKHHFTKFTPEEIFRHVRDMLLSGMHKDTK